MIVHDIPYFPQWESRELIPDFIAGTRRAHDDPLWQRSGAADVHEYALWSHHVCGMVCLRMVLKAWRGIDVPTMQLMRECRDFGGYIVKPDGSISGLHYRPFIRYVATVYGLGASLFERVAADSLVDMVGRGRLVIASVHPTIRTPEMPPPRQGGHLVLVYGVDNTQPPTLIFHNSSGITHQTQQAVRLETSRFGDYFSGRGICLSPR